MEVTFRHSSLFRGRKNVLRFSSPGRGTTQLCCAVLSTPQCFDLMLQTIHQFHNRFSQSRRRCSRYLLDAAHAGVASSPEVGCGEALGLERGLVTDSQISSSLAASAPERGRLNNPEAAWCFEWSKLNTTNQARHIPDICNLGKLLICRCVIFHNRRRFTGKWIC